MKMPDKNILVYADGSIEEISQPLEGMKFIQPRVIDGALWCREFEIRLATSGGNPPKGPCTMVGIETSFRLTKTAENMVRERAEWSAETMKMALWGIANYRRLAK